MSFNQRDIDQMKDTMDQNDCRIKGYITCRNIAMDFLFDLQTKCKGTPVDSCYEVRMYIQDIIDEEVCDQQAKRNKVIREFRLPPIKPIRGICKSTLTKLSIAMSKEYTKIKGEQKQEKEELKHYCELDFKCYAIRHVMAVISAFGSE